MWIALGDGGGVARFTPDGELDAVVDLPADFVSSLSFSGDRRAHHDDRHAVPGPSEVAGLPVARAAI